MRNYHPVSQKIGIIEKTFTTGPYKRPCPSGEPLDTKGLELVKESMDETLVFFRTIVQESRKLSNESMQQILSAKVWRGAHALEQKLVDELMHSDEYLENLVKDNQMVMDRIFMVCRRQKKMKVKLNPLSDIFSKMVHGAMGQYMETILSNDPYFMNESLITDPMVMDSQTHNLTDAHLLI